MEPMDIILASGSSSLSQKIRWMNWLAGHRGEAQKITHGAMVGFNDDVMESTTLNKWCDKSGFQTNPQDQWLHNYKGRVLVRKFLLSANSYETRYYKFCEALFGTEYENGIPGYFELLKTVFHFGFLPATENVHCTETDTRFFKVCSLLERHVLPYAFGPADYWQGGLFDDQTTGLWGPAELIKS